MADQTNSVGNAVGAPVLFKGNVITADDPRLTDPRAPKPHTHLITDINSNPSVNHIIDYGTLG